MLERARPESCWLINWVLRSMISTMKVGPGTDIETNTETVQNSEETSIETSTEIRRCIYIYKDLDCNSLYSICRHRDTPFLFYGKRKRPASRSFSSKSLYLSCYLLSSIISSISRGVTTYVLIGKCFRLPVTRYASSSFLFSIRTA